MVLEKLGKNVIIFLGIKLSGVIRIAFLGVDGFYGMRSSHQPFLCGDLGEEVYHDGFKKCTFAGGVE